MNTTHQITPAYMKILLTKYYKDPCNTTPRKFVKVNVSDRGRLLWRDEVMPNTTK
jgi:hypothetical protein